MTDRLQPRRVTVEDQKIKLLLYGNPGSGKTTLAATAGDHPALAPVLFLNFEGGLLSVVERGDVDEVQVQSMEDVETIFEALLTRQPGFQSYNTVVIDSGSELYQRSLTESVEQSIAKRRSGRTVDDIELGDYGRAARQTYRLFRAMRDLPLNVVVTAHAKFSYAQGADKRSSEPIEVGPAFSGQLATQLMGIFDFVHYLYVDSGTRYLLTQETGAYKAKTRGFSFAEQLGVVVANPDLPEMYDLLLSSSKGDGRPAMGRMEKVELPAEPEGEEIPLRDEVELVADKDGTIPSISLRDDGSVPAVKVTLGSGAPIPARKE